MSLLTLLLFHCHYLSLLHPSALKILLHLLPRSFNSKPLSTLTHQFSPFTLISFHVQLFSAILYSPLNMCLATSRPKFLSLSFLPSFSYNIDFLFVHFVSLYWTGIAQSVKRLATGRTVQGLNPGWCEIFRTSPDRPWGPTSLLYSGNRVSSRGIKRPGRGVDQPLHLALRRKKELNYTSILNLSLRGLF